jgi:hypothetical protein
VWLDTIADGELHTNKKIKGGEGGGGGEEEEEEEKYVYMYLFLSLPNLILSLLV